MERTFHKFPIICPTCKKPILITSVSFSVDNRVTIEGFCTNCLKPIEWEKSWEIIITTCFCKEQKARGNFVEGNNLIN